MRIFKTLGLTALLLTAAIPPARADYAVWQDEKTGLSLSFPDTWKIVNNSADNDVLSIMAPAGRANAMCRVRQEDDRRFTIYPPDFSASIQKIATSKEFWNDYIQQYTHGTLVEMYDGAGLGRGFASYATADYQNDVPGPMMERRGMMFATIYNGSLYVLDCSSHRDAFTDLKKSFLSVAKSIDFKKVQNQLSIGHYRNFKEDPRIEFIDIKGKQAVTY